MADIRSIIPQTFITLGLTLYIMFPSHDCMHARITQTNMYRKMSLYVECFIDFDNVCNAYELTAVKLPLIIVCNTYTNTGLIHN